MAPALSDVARDRQRSSVVLPAPERPMMATNWPGWTVAETASSARVAPKIRVARSRVMTGDTGVVMTDVTVMGACCPPVTAP